VLYGPHLLRPPPAFWHHIPQPLDDVGIVVSSQLMPHPADGAFGHLELLWTHSVMPHPHCLLEGVGSSALVRASRQVRRSVVPAYVSLADDFDIIALALDQ
jgi:hypothetical protein